MRLAIFPLKHTPCTNKIGHRVFFATKTPGRPYLSRKTSRPHKRLNFGRKRPKISVSLSKFRPTNGARDDKNSTSKNVRRIYHSQPIKNIERQKLLDCVYDGSEFLDYFPTSVLQARNYISTAEMTCWQIILAAL